MEKIETRLDDRLMCSIVEYLALAVIGAPQNVKCFHCAASDAVGRVSSRKDSSGRLLGCKWSAALEPARDGPRERVLAAVAAGLGEWWPAGAGALAAPGGLRH